MSCGSASLLALSSGRHVTTVETTLPIGRRLLQTVQPRSALAYGRANDHKDISR